MITVIYICAYIICLCRQGVKKFFACFVNKKKSMMRYIGQKHINIKKLYSGRNKDAGTDESAITVRKAESVQIPKGYTDGKKRCLKASRNAREIKAF